MSLVRCTWSWLLRPPPRSIDSVSLTTSAPFGIQPLVNRSLCRIVCLHEVESFAACSLESISLKPSLPQCAINDLRYHTLHIWNMEYCATFLAPDRVCLTGSALRSRIREGLLTLSNPIAPSRCHTSQSTWVQLYRMPTKGRMCSLGQGAFTYPKSTLPILEMHKMP